MSKLGFTTPTLHDCEGDIKADWYVDFRYTDNQTLKRKRFQYRMGINYLKTKIARYEEAKAVIALLTDSLKAGWNPFEMDITDYLVKGNSPQDDFNDLTQMSLPKALEFVVEKKKKTLSKATIIGYSSVALFASEAAVKIRLDELKVCEIKRRHIKMLLDQMQIDRQAAYDKEGKGKKFTGNNYNKYREFLHVLFTELEEFEIVEYNPCGKIAKKPETKSRPHAHASRAEEKLIKDKLKKDCYRLYVFLAFEELAELRPNEILGLKIKDINWVSQHFKVRAIDHAKTRVSRNAAIPNSLIPLIKSLKLDEYDKEYFIFSKDLMPGPKRWKRDMVSDLWKELIKIGLGIDISLYSFKGLGGEKKIAAGIDKQAVSKQMGHTDLKTTSIYLEREDERLDNLIINHTPEFDK